MNKMRRVYKSIETIVFVFAVLFPSCVSIRKVPTETRIQIKILSPPENVIYTAIQDFQKRLHSYDEFSSAEVRVYEYGEYIAVWICCYDEENEELFCNAFELQNLEDPWFPTQSMVVKGRLYYWHDDKYKVSDETMRLLKEHKRVASETDEIYVCLKDVHTPHYFFCKENLSKYKYVKGWNFETSVPKKKICK